MSNTEAKTEPLEGMTKVHDVCADTLNAPMSGARNLIDSAAECLFNCDYLQAAVRLEELKKIGTFTQTEMNIFDAASRDAA